MILVEVTIISTTYASDIAYGPLFEGYGICGGYTDAMELFLEKMGIESYKISSDQHVLECCLFESSLVSFGSYLG